MLEELLRLQQSLPEIARRPPRRRSVAALLEEEPRREPVNAKEEERGWEEWSLEQTGNQDQSPSLRQPAPQEAPRPVFLENSALRRAGITEDIYEVAAPAQEEEIHAGPQPREELYPRQRRVALREISDEMEFESRQYPRVEEDF